MQELRANTEVKVKIGPAVAVGDGFTPVTTLDLSTADEAELFKHDSAAVTSIAAATFAAITNADGYYNLTLTTSLTDTEGLLDVVINDDSLILPIRARFMVLSEAAWDSKYLAKDDGFMDVNVKAISEDTTAADTLESILDSTVTGTADSGTTTTMVDAARTEADTDYWAGDWILFTSGTIAGQCRLITAFTPGTDTITFAPATTQAVSTNTYEIIPAGRVDVHSVAGTAQTARDIGASVLLSNGTGAGQVKIASGYLAMTWADIGSPTTTVNLSGTTIKTATDVETDTAEIGVAGAGLTNINLPNQTMDIVGNITGNLSGSVGSVTGAVGSVTGNVGGNVAGSVGSVTGNVGGNVTGSVGSIATGGISSGSFAAGAITATVIATNAIDDDALSNDAVTAMQSGLATSAALSSLNLLVSSLSLTKVISAVNSQTSFDLTSGPSVDNALVGWTVVFYDNVLDAGHADPTFAVVSAYTASNERITLAAAPARTISENDIAYFIPPDRAAIWPTMLGRTLDVSSGGAAGVDWANVETPGSTVNLSATTVNLTNTVTTYTGNTPQTGDAYAIVNSGTHGNSAIKNETAAIKAKTDSLTFTTANKVDAKLTSDGLDSIAATTPTGVASTFATKMMQLWARFFGRVTKDSDEIKTYRSDGTTVATTQTYTSSGDDDDVGAAS